MREIPTHLPRRLSKPLKPKSTISFIDLFSGIGGFHMGLENVAYKMGYDIKLKFASDIDEKANEVYKNNYGAPPRGDIHDINAGEASGATLLFGGFPCQPFSNSGLKRGLKDHRGVLFYQIKRLIEGSTDGKLKGHVGPKAFVLENVAGLLKNGKGKPVLSRLHDGPQRLIGPTMQHLEEELSKMKDYCIRWKELDSSKFGSPQIRKRVYIVGIQKDLLTGDGKFHFPLGYTPVNTIRKILDPKPHDMLKLNKNQEANIREDIHDKRKPSFRDGMRRVGQAYHCPGGNVGQCYHVDGLSPTLTRIWTRFLPLYIPHHDEDLPKSVMDDAFDPGPSYGKGILRKASVRECLRLQGFPDDYNPADSDADSYEQIGNAVNCLVVKAIMINLIPLIS